MIRYLILLAFMFSYSLASGAVQPFHLDSQLLPAGCGTCHAGFNFKDGGGPLRCVLCHGPRQQRPAIVTAQSSMEKLKDISREFNKNFRHPSFEKATIHRTNEVLPEQDPALPRHAECVDCHNPHYISAGASYAGLKARKVGNFAAAITKEYELCYLCHGNSANLPVKATNKRLEFSLSNQSFHPVEGEGKNSSVISLIRPYREKKTAANDISVIRCADCHGSDDPNAPAGPHGSKYEGLLVDNFQTSDGIAESSQAYALCYRCHRRTSILGNESFPAHSRHITGERNFKGGGTSCNTCHTSHGSAENRYLIRFNRLYVSESSSGKLKFVEKGSYSFHGECWLTCHGVDHNPKSY